MENVKLDLSYLQNVASGNVEFIIEMVDLFLEQTPLYVEKLSNAVQSKTWKDIAQTAHKIKPTLSFIGIESARETMAGIEMKAREEADYDYILKEFTNMKPMFDEVYVKLRETREELLKDKN